MFPSFDIYTPSDWKVWLVIVLIVLLLLWIFFGGDQQEFIGLKPIFDDSDDELDESTNEELEEYTDDDTDSSYNQNINMNFKNSSNLKENVTYINRSMSSSDPPGIQGYSATNGEPISNTVGQIDPPSYISSKIKRRNFSNDNKFNKPKHVNFEKQFLKTNGNPNIKPPIPQMSNYYPPSHNNSIPFEKRDSPPIIRQAKLAHISRPPNYGKNLKSSHNNKAKKFVEPSKGEAITRKAMEDIYGVPFINSRPDFLKNPETLENLELDCYNADLAIAAEYNGIQHYLWPNYTNQTEQQFHNQLRRDEFKINQCDLNGVYLITVPYEVPYDMIPKYIEYYLPENVAARQESLAPQMIIHSIS